MAVRGSNFEMWSQDVVTYLFSFFDKEELSRAECVCREWKQFAAADPLWRSLFVRTFNENPPGEVDYKKAFRQRWGIVLLKGPDQLFRVAAIFWSTLQLGQPKKMVVYAGPVGDVQRQFYLEGEIKRANQETLEATTISYQYEGDIIGGQPTEGPSSLVTQARGGCLLRLEIAGADCINAMHALNPFTRCEFAEIETLLKADHTLGYISSIDDYKEKFKLNCVVLVNGGISWVGFIPMSTFRFVEINSQNEITRTDVERSLEQPGDLGRSVGLSRVF